MKVTVTPGGEHDWLIWPDDGPLPNGVEEFGQLRVREALRRRLDELLPEPLADVRVREDEERAEVARRLADTP